MTHSHNSHTVPSHWRGQDREGNEIEIEMAPESKVYPIVDQVLFSLPPETVVDTDPVTGEVKVVIPFEAIKTLMGDWIINRKISKLEDARDSPALVFEEYE